MSFSIIRDGDRIVAEIPPQLVIGNRQELKQRLLDELQRGGRNFVIDFGRTKYVDSSGLGVLVSLSRILRDNGGNVRLANLSENLKTLFALTRLDRLFQIGDDDNGLADRPALRRPPPGPIEGRAAAEWPDPDPPA